MKYLSGIFLAVMMVSCHDPSTVDHEQVLTESVNYAQAPAARVLMPEHKRVLLYEASLNLLVTSIKAVNDSVQKLLPAFEAHVSNESAVDYGSSREQKMEIRVVEQNFYGLLARLESLGAKTINRELNIRDVTTEYIDMEARLKTKKELENRYYEILKQAKTVEDMLAIEEQLGEVRAEIESMESRKKHIDSRAAYSTISLAFSENLESENALLGQVTASLKSGWDSIIQFFLALLSLWPWVIVGSGLIILILRWWRKKYSTMNPV